jgi:NADH dehydrogenase
MKNKKVVIVGAGFAGLLAAKELKNTSYEITIIDKNNHHLFQPLLYQVATAALSPGDIAVPIRGEFSGEKNINIIMGEAEKIDKINKVVELKDVKVPFDYLIVATGARHSYFGKNEWEQYAPGLKTIQDALYIREKILRSLEEAEKCNPENYQKYLTYIIVGGGPTGVELAGAIAEIAKKTWMNDFRNINASKTRVYLIEALPRLLMAYPEELSRKAREELESMGVIVKTNTMVLDVNEKGVNTKDGFIDSVNVIWAAGNSASPLLKTLDTETDKAGRVIVNNDLTIPGYPDIFVLGDAAALKDEHGNFLPAVAQVAMQEGRYAARILKDGIPQEKRAPFRYKDKGIMATVGRAKAVAYIRGFKLSGFFAWLTWSFVHVMFLIGFRNRIRVMVEWSWYYVTLKHGIRLITGKNNGYY